MGGGAGMPGFLPTELFGWAEPESPEQPGMLAMNKPANKTPTRDLFIISFPFLKMGLHDANNRSRDGMEPSLDHRNVRANQADYSPD